MHESINMFGPGAHHEFLYRRGATISARVRFLQGTDFDYSTSQRAISDKVHQTGAIFRKALLLGPFTNKFLAI